MPVTKHVPGMKPGATRRNVALAVLAVLLFPITLLVALVYVPVALALNRNGLADAMAGTPLRHLPGLGGAGLKTGAVAFVYLFVLVGIVLAGLPGGTDPGNTDAAAGPSNPDAVATEDEADSETTAGTAAPETPARTRTATGTTEAPDTPTATDRPAPTARPTVTSEETVTPAPTPSPNPTPASTSTPEVTPTPTPASTTEAPRGPAEGSEWTVTVTRVVDGDTLEVRFPDGSEADVRLLGVDTPEVHTSTSPGEFEGIPASEAGRDWLRDWGHKASEFARTELAGETVTIRTDPTAGRRGSYGRLLVYVSQDGTDFNHELVAQGYARLYDTTFDRRDAYATAERTAQSNDVGLWNYETPPTPTPTATPVPDGGSSPSDLAVATVHADAAGNDHENENGEYVVFENTGDGTLDLSGWTVSDEADHTYVFGDVALEPGDTVTLYTGSGTDTENEVYWGSGAAIWNNGGDTITVTTADGETALERSYS